MEANLEKIANKYRSLACNEDNYSVGGGLSCNKYASKRHEDAISDTGKLTLGKAKQLFSKATGVSIHEVEALLRFKFDLEWHHAGKLPKKYGGGMKKTYFVKSDEIVYLAENWCKITKDYQRNQILCREVEMNNKSLADRRLDFLKSNAEKKVRVLPSVLGKYYIEIDREMKGKYGWFSSQGKTYNLPEYYTAWVLNEESYNKYNQIV